MVRFSFLPPVHMSLTTLKSLWKVVVSNYYLRKGGNIETIFSFVKVCFLLTFKLPRNFMEMNVLAHKSLLYLF